LKEGHDLQISENKMFSKIIGSRKDEGRESNLGYYIT
jgi:hypothetical protein